MKMIKYISTAAVTVSIFAAPLAGFAAEAKPYKLDKCIVTDEKLGEMGKPFVFEYKGQEVKLCCKSCKKDFDKEPEKFMKKLEGAEKKPDTAKPGTTPGHEGHNH
jgi:YHS domain-containing protein